MGTTIRPELSKKNPYWIEKHRYYELKHFCLQYPIWRQAYNSLGGLSSRQSDLAMCSSKYNMSNPTERIASSNDITTTKRMEETGILVGIRMLDHVIITEDNCYSVCTNGYIREEN